METTFIINVCSDEEQQSINLLEEMRKKTLGKELEFSVYAVLFITKWFFTL